MERYENIINSEQFSEKQKERVSRAFSIWLDTMFMLPKCDPNDLEKIKQNLNTAKILDADMRFLDELIDCALTPVELSPTELSSFIDFLKSTKDPSYVNVLKMIQEIQG